MTDDRYNRADDDLKDLRNRAERLLQRLTPDQDVATLTPEQLQTIIHELQVSQTELEIQNEELRRAERELSAVRDTYADLFDYAPIGYFIFDRHGVILNLNFSGARLLESEKRFLRNKPFVSMVMDYDRPKFYSHLKQVFDSLVTQTCEIRLAAKQISSRPVMLESRAVLGANGEIESCRTAVVDLSEIKGLQEEVLRTQEQALSSMNEGVSVTDENGIVSFINHAFEKMFGYELAEVVGRNVVELGECLDDAVSRNLSEIIARLNAKRQWRAELRCSRKDGASFYANVSGTVLDLFGKRSLIFVWEDITAFKKAQEALFDSEQRLRAIFESATDLMFIKDRSFKYTHVNPAFEELAGIPAAEIVGHTYEELFGDQGAAYLRDVDARVLKGETIEHEIVMTVSGAQRRFQEVRIPLRDDQRNVFGVCCIGRDITERVERLLPPRRHPEAYSSPAMKAVLHLADRAAKTDSVVLLRGETGTGKDYLARYIHDQSGRAGGPFYSINCGAVPESLAESELFGHERGAFTGAHARKRGLLELAEGGTLLLNEVGELPMALQSKLLTFLDTRQIQRIGGEKSISVNARLIAATNRDLEQEVDAGRFRQDLLYRISVMVIRLPPLRERLEDLPALIGEIHDRLSKDLQITRLLQIHPSTLQALKQYHWPGNVRELRNVLERALILGTQPRVESAALDLASRGGFRIRRGRLFGHRAFPTGAYAAAILPTRSHRLWCWSL